MTLTISQVAIIYLMLVLNNYSHSLHFSSSKAKLQQAQPGSLLEKAVNYAKNSWDELFTYREYGYLEMSNNLAERSVKPFVIARKNFLFSKTENGAQASGLLFSIIQTAKANGLCIERYLEYVLNSINKLNIDDILPWSKKLPKELKLNLK
jgi:transposase